MNWIAGIRLRNPGHSLARIFWWRFLQGVLNFLLSLFYRFETTGSQNIPASGPVLLICNHQSFLDLPMLGAGIGHRHFHSMARSTLFKGLLGPLIRSLNAFPVDQESKGDLKAMRTALEVLEQGHLLLIFPEGSRTSDGTVRPFRKGVQLLFRRAEPTIVPAAVEGVFDVWPIGRKYPRPSGRVAVTFGEPIPYREISDLSGEQALETLRDRVDELRRGLRDRMRRASDGHWPPPGAADGSPGRPSPVPNPGSRPH